MHSLGSRSVLGNIPSPGHPYKRTWKVECHVYGSQILTILYW